MLEAARGTRWEPYVLLSLATGCRRSELIALDWTDLNAETGTLTIRASMTETWREENGRRVRLIERKGTKTDRVRVIPLAAFAIDALEKQRLWQSQDAFAAEDSYEPSGAIFTDELGCRYRPMRLNDAYRRDIALKAKVPTGLHTLRHSAVTILLTAGVDVCTVAGLAGIARR